MNFYEMAEKVDSKESFLRFAQALAEDAEAADGESERTADGKRPGRAGCEQVSLW